MLWSILGAYYLGGVLPMIMLSGYVSGDTRVGRVARWAFVLLWPVVVVSLFVLGTRQTLENRKLRVRGASSRGRDE